MDHNREAYLKQWLKDNPTQQLGQTAPSQPKSVKSVLFDEDKFRDLLPAEMLAAKRWMRYFLKPKPEGGAAKIPLGNHSDSSTWSTFEECVAALEPGQGLGYAFYKGDIEAVDVDHCCNPNTGQICNEVMLLMGRLRPCWAEYSVSGKGIHILGYDGKGLRHTKPLTETCLQAWPSQRSARFFALTCRMVGTAPDFNKLGDWNGQTNYVYSDAKRISAKIREELRTVDPEQWASLPVEREPNEQVTRERSKTKTRKVHKEFNITDFLAFYGLGIDNECDNELGHCIRVTTCPIKGEPHVGHNGTTCNFIYPCKDGGLAFHCQSTGCVEYGVGDVIKKLAGGEQGPYPRPIYEDAPKGEKKERVYRWDAQEVGEDEMEHCVWLWPGYLQANQLTHHAGASAEGKSPVSRDLIARVSSGASWPDGAPNTFEKRMVLVLASEDDWPTVIVPHLKIAGANFTNIRRFRMTMVDKDATASEAITALDRDIEQLEECLRHFEDKVGMIVIDPITNYLGRCSMNKEDEMRSLLMPLANLAQRYIVSINTFGHLNKNFAVPLLQRVMGAAAFIGVARQTLFYVQDPMDESEFAHVLGFGRKTTTPGMRYKTEARPLEFKGKTSNIICVKWCGSSTVDIEEAVANPTKQADKSASKQVQVLVKTLLRDGAKLSAEVEEAIKQSGITITDWQKAARRVAESRKRPGTKVWEWFIPAPEQAEFDNTQRKPPQKEVTA